MSIVRQAVVRGFFASLAGRFWCRASAGVGGVSFCFRLSIKSGYSSIIIAYMQIFLYLCSIINRFSYGKKVGFLCPMF